MKMNILKKRGPVMLFADPLSGLRLGRRIWERNFCPSPRGGNGGGKKHVGEEAGR
jgi:hypothetical protein